MAIVIGEGTPTGTDLFEDIDWNEEPLYIKTELQYPVGGSYTEMGTAPLMSVPYAMVADSLSRPLTKLTVKGETTDMEEALFEVRNKDGQIIFAVYNEGVRAYVSDGDAKGVKGGFAIGGFGADKQGVQKYFFVSGDSIRAYIDSTSTKAVKGGFAIGGFENTKAPGQEYLRVTRDSVRIYLDANPETKSVKGGFAIGGFEKSKGNESFFNVAIDTSGKIDPSENRILCYPLKNAFTTGSHSYANEYASFASGYHPIANGDYSTSIGSYTISSSGYEMAVGRYNTTYTPISTTDWDALDRLFVIGNGTSEDLRSDALTVLKNGNIGIGTSTPGYTLTVNGTAWCSSGAWIGSDMRWKKNISSLTDILPLILKLDPVSYEFRTEEFTDMGFVPGKQIGLIAQDVEKIFPELVNTDNNGYKAIAYDKLGSLLVEAIKEQQAQIESTQQENRQFKSELETLKERMAAVEAMLGKD